MCDSDLDTILSYLSSKINKIFCDREFVGCIKEDFSIILRNTNNYCVVFPKLKPIFLKVLRYQAELFDLSVICIGSGPNQVALVCKNAFLKEPFDECPSGKTERVSKTMSEDEDKTSTRKSNRINRPTQPYYVPPAQRSTTKKKIDFEGVKTTKKTRIKSKFKQKDSGVKIADINVLQSKITCDNKGLEETEVESAAYCNSCVNNDNTYDTAINNVSTLSESYSEPITNISQLPSDEYKQEKEECEIYLNEKEHLQNLVPASCATNILSNSNEIKEFSEKHSVSPYLLERQSSSLLAESVQNSLSENVETDNAVLDDIFQDALQKPSEYINLSLQLDNTQVNEKLSSGSTEQIQNVDSEGLKNPENNSNDVTDGALQMKLGLHDLQVLTETTTKHTTENPGLKIATEYSKIQHPIQDKNIVENVETRLIESESEFKANNFVDEEAVKEELKQKLRNHFNTSCFVTSSHDKLINEDPDHVLLDSLTLSSSVCEGDSSIIESVVVSPPSLQKCAVSDFHVNEEQQIQDRSPLYISYDDDDDAEKKAVNCDEDDENEEMQRAIENINRKSRSLIKHNIRNVNMLGIDENKKNCTIKNSERGKNSSIGEEQSKLSNWEDMFDENGDLQAEYNGEIVKYMGCDVKVLKASHDYSAYQNTKYQDLEHVIELYDFPSTFKTQDLIQLYRGASQDPMYIKWCDDTHALLVLSTPVQAQRALQIEHDVIKSRPLSQASTTAALTASSADLKPAMKRPQTNMQTARRLINTHLGTKSTLSREEVEQEQRALRDAREQRRQERQNEKDAWEGRPRNAKSHSFF